MGKTTFCAKIKEFGRDPVVFAERTQVGEKIEYRWCKPAHVIDKMRGSDVIISMQGAGVYPFRDFDALAVEVDRCVKKKANVARGYGALVHWCAGKWGTCRNEAMGTLHQLSDTTVLDWARDFQADAREQLLS